MSKTGLTPQVIDFAMRTLKLSSDDLLSLVLTVENFSGEDPYDSWLAHEIVKMAETEGIPFSQLPLKWTGFIADIKSGFDKTSKVHPDLVDRLQKYLGVKNIGFGGLDSLPKVEVDDSIDWLSALDLNVFEATFVSEFFDSETQKLISENEDSTPWSIVGELRSTKLRRTELFGSLKLKAYYPSNIEGEQMLYRLINLSETAGLSGCTLILQSDFDFWSNLDLSLWEEFTQNFRLKDTILAHPSELYADAASFKNQIITIWEEGHTSKGIEANGLLYSRDLSVVQKEHLKQNLKGSTWSLSLNSSGVWVASSDEGGLSFSKDEIGEVAAMVGLTEALAGLIPHGSLPRLQSGMPYYSALEADSIPILVEKLNVNDDKDFWEKIKDKYWSSMQIESKSMFECLLNEEKVPDNLRNKVLTNLKAYRRS